MSILYNLQSVIVWSVLGFELRL